MPSRMPRQKRDRNAIKFADYERIRRRTKRRLNRLFANIFQFRHLVKTAAADYSNLYVFHRVIFKGQLSKELANGGVLTVLAGDMSQRFIKIVIKQT